MSAVTKIVDIDALLDDEPDEPVGTADIKLFGETFKIRKDVNAFNLVAMSDPDQVGAAFTRTLVGAVVAEDRQRFVETMAKQERLGAKKLNRILEAVLEAASDDRPTNSSPASRRTTPKKAAVKRSAAR